MKKRSIIYICLILCTSVVVLVLGCARNSPAEVQGTITIKGHSPKIAGLTISFIGIDGKPVTAPVDSDGKYTIAQAPVGEVKIGFGVAQAMLTSESSPQDRIRELETKRQVKDAGGFPDKYRDPRTSGITTTLSPGSNTFDFDIK